MTESVGRAGTAEEFYAASYARLVAVVTLAAGSRSEAEDVVQEAFARLLPRWATVGDYDNPEAWVRKVAFRLLANRRRRLANGLRAATRTGPKRPSEPASGDSVDVARALSTLPIGQRHVVVLHHLLDLDVVSVASELGVAVGTVKSRLARARNALEPLLREEVADHA